ncbi:hypothetical protein Btru_006313 [Bulinus truncatus]|nr:hypothetical protein Btru_006313 [Bulinus truncatus]
MKCNKISCLKIGPLMAVIKTAETKSAADGMMWQAQDPPANQAPSSPVPSYTGSQDSHSFLLPAASHVIKEESKGKKKKAVVIDAKVARQQIFKNALWLLLFTSLFALVVCVVITLANSFQDGFFFKGLSDGVVCTPFGRCESKSSHDKSSVANLKTPDGLPGYTQQQCMYQRALWEGGAFNSEIIHDLKAKWSTLVDHNEQRCLLFEIHLDDLIGCPQEYPWFLDMRVGIPVCRTILDRIAPIRRVMRHILDDDVQNLTSIGYITARKCIKYKTAIIDKVIVQYFDINNNRVAKRSVDYILRSNRTAQEEEVAELKKAYNAFKAHDEEALLNASQKAFEEFEHKQKNETEEVMDFLQKFYDKLEKKSFFPARTENVPSNDDVDTDLISDKQRIKRANSSRNKNKRRPTPHSRKPALNRPKPKKPNKRPRPKRDAEDQPLFEADTIINKENRNAENTVDKDETLGMEKDEKLSGDEIKMLKNNVQRKQGDGSETDNIWAQMTETKRSQKAGRSSSHDFIYGSLIPEAKGHWELILSSVNDDGRALVAEKIERMPDDLNKVNQFLRPLLEDVNNVIQAVLKLEPKKAKNLKNRIFFFKHAVCLDQKIFT